ncbi:MAG: GNAT family N-acetyltransferase [Mycobacteriales bacterium]
MLTDVWPLFGLVLRTPRLELRLPSPEQLAALGELAAEGVHDPAAMPFLVPWTDSPPAERARSALQYQWSQWGRWTPRDWRLELAVLAAGQAIGLQGLGATDFAVTRQVHTGSWLGRRHHRQGYGTEMRAAVLHLAFAGLGAEQARSGALADNAASLAVSRKLGYVEDGTARHCVRDRLVTDRRLLLDRARWEAHRTVPVQIDGLPPCLPLLGLAPVGPAGGAAAGSGT